MKQYINQFFYLLDVQAKKAIPFLIVAFLLSSLLDVIGIGLIGIFLGLLTNPQLFFQKFPFVANFLAGLSEKKLVLYFGLLIVSAFAIKTVVTLKIQAKLVYFCQALSVRLKARLMRAYQHAPYTYHLEKNSAYLLSRIHDNINNYINNILMPTLNLISSGIITLSILTFLVILHPFSTLFLGVMLVLLGMGYDFFAKKRLSLMGKTVAVASGEIVKSIHQGLHGLNEVRVLGKEEYFLQRLRKASSQYAHAYGALAAMQLTPRYLLENTMAIFIVGLSIGGIAAGFDMSIIVATVGMFAAAGTRLLPTVTQTMSAISQVRGSYHHMHLVGDDLLFLEQFTNHTSKTKMSPSKDGKLDFTHIRLKEVYYNYPQANRPTLENIEFQISKGQSIGLIGPSGAGKSTLVNLILGFLDPKKGQILVDDKSIQDHRAWLNNFAYIPQSIFLLDDTLKRNIAFGLEDTEIDDQQVAKAIQMAQLTDVASNLPNGIETLLGENGVRLSGGQRQRVALARAFYHERDIIVLDEATSSLDHETEREVINTIKRLKGNKTLIVIAHRLTTVEHCDTLYRIENGHIAAVGTFQDVVGVASPV